MVPSYQLPGTFGGLASSGAQLERTPVYRPSTLFRILIVNDIKEKREARSV